ncbi:MAG: hypothetical protein ABI448_11015 [Bacteroidia bacterium]
MSIYKFILKNVWLFASLIYTGIVLWYSNTPVFWDMYGQVKTAHFYLETNFTNLFPNGNGFTDNGYFPIYTLYLAACFKLFGFKLWVAHLSVLPFIIGLFYQLQHFCKRFLSDEKAALVLLLTLIHPVIAAQNIYFSSEICFVFLSAWMLNTINDVRASRMVLSSTLLCLLNLRALPFIVLLFIYFVFIKKQKSAWYLVAAVLFSMVWIFIHFHISGWFFENPENIGHRTLIDFNQMLKNFFWCMVKLTDYANIVAIIFIVLFCFSHKKMSEPVVFVLLAALSIFIFCVPLSNPIGNRYFLVVYVLMLPAFVLSISHYSLQKIIVTCLIFVLFLVQSSWLTKPDKYGNAWDCTLKSLTYFDVRKELDTYVAENQIAVKDVAAGFQLYFNDEFYLMNNSTKEYSLLSDTEMPQNLYVADSNICNNYNPERKAYLEKNYSLIKSFTKGAVYVRLFKRK